MFNFFFETVLLIHDSIQPNQDNFLILLIYEILKIEWFLCLICSCLLHLCLFPYFSWFFTIFSVLRFEWNFYVSNEKCVLNILFALIFFADSSLLFLWTLIFKVKSIFLFAFYFSHIQSEVPCSVSIDQMYLYFT